MKNTLYMNGPLSTAVLCHSDHNCITTESNSHNLMQSHNTYKSMNSSNLRNLFDAYPSLVGLLLAVTTIGKAQFPDLRKTNIG